MAPLPKYCLFCFKADEKELKIKKSKTISFQPKTKNFKYITKRSHTSGTNKLYASCDEKSCQRQDDHENKVIKINVINWEGKCQIFTDFT